MDENRNPMAHSPLGKRKALPDDEDSVQGKRLIGGAVPHLNHRNNSVSALQKTSCEVAGRIAGIELENFMCHGNLKIAFNVRDNNCFYIGGPNGSGKSALFAAMNIGLGGRGNHNDRGNSVKGYIKEGQTRAKIRVILTNKGEGRIDKFGDFIIVERTITHTTSTYSLKSQSTGHRETHRETVSTKKSELDGILTRFGIELNNPIYWMSQDRSRHFLQKMDPSKLYEIFMKATELESTAESYEKCEEIHKEIRKILEGLKKDIGDQQKEIEKWKDDKNRVKKELDLMRELDLLMYYSQWAPVRDAEEELKHWENMQNQIRSSMASVNQQQYHNGVDQNFAREQLEELHRKIKEHKGVVDQYKDELRKIEEDLRVKGNEANLIEGKLQKILREISDDKAGIRDAERNLEVAMRRAETNETLRELAANKNKMDRLVQKETDVSDERRAIEREVETLKDERKTVDRERREANAYFYEMTSKFNEMKQFLQSYDASQKDKMSRFGDKMALVLQLIQMNSSKFEKQPKGPLGSYIKVKNPKWLLAIEEALRNHLSCFIFNSKRDSDVFHQIIREANSRGAQISAIPNTIVTKFGLPPHNTGPNEPSDRYKTILREIEINDVDVKNTFIDLDGIESHLLFDSDQEARQEMNGRCPQNCMKAQTATGAQLYGSNARGGQYRFYGCKKNRPMMLTSSESTSDRKVLEQEFDIYARKREIAGKKRNEVDLRHRQLMDRVTKLEVNKEAMETELGFVKDQIRKIRRKIVDLEGKEDDDQIIDNLRASVATLEENILKWEDKKSELTGQLAAINEEIQEKDREKGEVCDELEGYTAEYLPREEEVMALNMKIRTYARMDEDCTEKVKMMKAELEERERQRVAKLRAVEEARKKATKYKEDNPSCPDGEPDPNQLPGTDFLVRGCIEKEAALRQLRNSIVNLISNEEMARRKELYNKAKLLYTQLRMLFIQIQDCFKIRKENFPVMRAAITMRLKRTFRRLIRIRFQGVLEVDDKKKEIRISVQPHKTANEGVQDLKGLSGGERSYTTACFVMALWDIMEAPFRCMDEFDVFMDMINRKVVMDLLVKLATEEYPHHQFLFFTPQGINELGEKNRVEIYEMPKVRP